MVNKRRLLKLIISIRKRNDQRGLFLEYSLLGWPYVNLFLTWYLQWSHFNDAEKSPRKVWHNCWWCSSIVWPSTSWTVTWLGMFYLYIIQSDKGIAWLWSCHVWSLCDTKYWKSTKVSILPTSGFWGRYKKNFLKNSYDLLVFSRKKSKIAQFSSSFDLVFILTPNMKYYLWRHQWRHWWKPSNLSQQQKEKHYQEGNHPSATILLIFKDRFFIENAKNDCYRRIFIWDLSHIINFSRENLSGYDLGISVPTKYQVISISNRVSFQLSYHSNILTWFYRIRFARYFSIWEKMP